MPFRSAWDFSEHKAPNKGGKNIRLYRAVMPEELADIETTGRLINRGSAEGKYFSATAEGLLPMQSKRITAFMIHHTLWLKPRFRNIF